MAEETLTESTETTVNTNEQVTPAESEQAEQANNGNDELAKAKADLAKLKAALDNATREAGNYRKQLRAKQSAEEIAAEEQKAQDEAKQKRLEELEREIAKINTVKSVMSKLGTDESVAGKIAEYLYGAEDADAALTELQRYWTAKEKALRLEYGKIPAPGIGGANGEDAERQKAINLAKEIGRERAQSGKSLREQLGSYIR
jgi:hypothetical protein